MKLRCFLSNFLLLLFITIFVTIIWLFNPQPSFASEEWSEPIDISNSTVPLFAPPITAGSNSEVYVAWQTPGGGGTEANVLFTKKSGGSWAEPSIVNPGTIGPHTIVVDSSGMLNLIYNDTDPPYLLNHRVYDGISWSHPIPISEEISGNIQWSSLTIDSINNPYVVLSYTPTGNNARVYYSKKVGDSWQIPWPLTLSNTFS